MDTTGNAIEILKSHKGLEANFGTGPVHFGPVSVEEERREVLESVVEALTGPDLDADRLAACASLLRGLMARPHGAGGRLTAGAPACPGAGRGAAQRRYARRIAWHCRRR